MNDWIKNQIKESGFRQYEVADAIGVHESNFSRWFRKEMTQNQKLKILNALKKLSGEEKKNRWSESDKHMAMALLSVGFESVKFWESGKIYAHKPGLYWHVPSGLFEPLKPGETVQLSDIIAEGAEQ